MAPVTGFSIRSQLSQNSADRNSYNGGIFDMPIRQNSKSPNTSDIQDP